MTVAPVKAAIRIMFLPPEIDLLSQLFRAERVWIFAALWRLRPASLQRRRATTGPRRSQVVDQNYLVMSR